MPETLKIPFSQALPYYNTAYILLGLEVLYVMDLVKKSMLCFYQTVNEIDWNTTALISHDSKSGDREDTPFMIKVSNNIVWSSEGGKHMNTLPCEVLLSCFCHHSGVSLLLKIHVPIAWPVSSLGTRRICKLILYLFWQTGLSPLLFRQISTWADHNRSSNMGAIELFS